MMNKISKFKNKDRMSDSTLPSDTGARGKGKINTTTNLCELEHLI